MSNHIFNVLIYHIFIKSKKPIRFASEDELQAAIQEAVTNSSTDYTQRIFEFNTLEEAQRKANEIKFDGNWQYDEGYSRPSKWYYLDMEVAQIFEDEILDNGDFGDEPISESAYFHPNIPIDNGSSPVIEVTHPNGFSGKLYGKSSLIIFKDGKEVMHTGFREINTAEELYNELEEMPEFLKMLGDARKEQLGDKSEEK